MTAYLPDEEVTFRDQLNHVYNELAAAVPAMFVVGAAIVCGLLVGGVGKYVFELALGVLLIVIIERRPDLVLLCMLPVFTLVAPIAPQKALELLPVVLLIEVVSRGLSGRYKIPGVYVGVSSLLALWIMASGILALGQGVSPSFQYDIVDSVLALSFGVVAAILRPRRDWLLTAITASGVVMAFSVRFSAAVAGASAAKTDVTRASALGLNPNGVALFLALGVVAGLGKLVTTRRPAWLIPLAIMIASFPLAKSRASLLIVAGGLLGFVIFSRSMRLRVAAIVLTGVIVLVVPNIRTRIVDATLQGRAHQLSAESDDARRHAAIKAFHLGMQHPVLGIGWGEFPNAAAADPSVGVAIVTHDDYARLLAEAGWPALALFCALFFLAFRGRSEDDLDWALKALLCAMAVSLVTANVLYNIPSAFPYMAVIGTMAGTDFARRAERAEQRKTERAAKVVTVPALGNESAPAALGNGRTSLT
jgi:hypothetical protein